MQHWNRRQSLTALAATLLSACSSNEDGTAPAASGSLTIATNPAGTNVYAVAAAIAKLLQEDLQRRTTIRPFSGSSVYLPMLQRGDLALGLNTNIDGYLSYRGIAPYESPMPELRTLGMMFALDITFMVRADSGLERIEDLRGRSVVVTFRANAALEQLHRGILATGDMSFDDIEAVTVAGLPEGVTALQEGRADAIPIGLGTALGLQANASIPGGIRYLTMGADEPRLAEIMPGTRIAAITPRPNEVGIPDTIRVSSVPDMLNTGTHLTDEDAYAIIRSLHRNWGSLRDEVPQLAAQQAMDLAPADNMHPYHPGAIRYFREVGLWTGQHEANQLELLALAGIV